MLRTHIGHARYVYNIGLEQRKLLDRNTRQRGIRVTTNDQMTQLTEARREFEWLRNGSTVVQQGALRDLDRAFRNFFEKRSRFPKFKKRSNRESFIIRDVQLHRYNRKWAAIAVPKAGLLKFRLTRSWHEVVTATSARVSLRNGRWHVSLTTPPREKRTGGSGVVGIDRGVAVSVMTSDGEALHAPSLRDGEQRRFLKLERELEGRSRRSRNRERTNSKLAALRRRLDYRRTDWVEQETTRLATVYELAAVENLNITGMVKRPEAKPDPELPGGFIPNEASAKSGLARAIHASQWGKFVKRLSDKMDVKEVPAANTSRRCNECGHTEKRNRESQAVFTCKDCGHRANADVNAARNIRYLAICGGTHRERVEPSGDTNLQAAS
jgi:transposase